VLKDKYASAEPPSGTVFRTGRRRGAFPRAKGDSAQHNSKDKSKNRPALFIMKHLQTRGRASDNCAYKYSRTFYSNPDLKPVKTDNSCNRLQADATLVDVEVKRSALPRRVEIQFLVRGWTQSLQQCREEGISPTMTSYGITACTAVENELSWLLESTAVAT
jgi:hypothetical protein